MRSRCRVPDPRIVRSIRNLDGIAIAAACKRPHDAHRIVAQESYRTVRKCKIRTARMRAPEMVNITFVVKPAWTEPIGPKPTRSFRVARFQFLDAKQKLARPGP